MYSFVASGWDERKQAENFAISAIMTSNIFFCFLDWMSDFKLNYAKEWYGVVGCVCVSVHTHECACYVY